MNEDIIGNMKARIAQCRRLAGHINDPRTTAALLKMAEEGERDLSRLVEQAAERPGN